MALIIVAAVMAMILVLARANQANARRRSDPQRVEHSDARYPGLDPAAVRTQARKVGDDPNSDDAVEPGGHVIHQSGGWADR
jgi:hypothetical protein